MAEIVSIHGFSRDWKWTHFRGQQKLKLSPSGYLLLTDKWKMRRDFYPQNFVGKGIAGRNCCLLFSYDDRLTATYARASKQLDNIYVSPVFKNLPASFIPAHATIPRVHRSLGSLDIAEDMIRFCQTPLITHCGRQLKNHNPQIHEGYIQVYKEFSYQNKIFDWETVCSRRLLLDNYYHQLNG